MIEGRATPEGTAAYAARHAMPGHYRNAGGLTLSSVGHGSYLGGTANADREAYQEAIGVCLRGGINVLDTASNYRDQASERDVGRALAQYIDDGDRSEVLVASKAGFLHGDADSEMRGPDWFQQEYVLDGTVRQRDIVGNVHCMTPAYIDRELQRSRRNLDLETIDVYFVHNPETQLAEGVPEDEFLGRLRDAFELLERRADDGHIKVYGIATWDGLRAPPGHPAHTPLVKVIHEAGQAAMAVGRKASQHRFRAVELPVNMAMPEAATVASQPWKFGEQTALQCLLDTGMLTFASASLMQARLEGRVPQEWKDALGTASDLQTALQFTRSQPITTALVGMGQAKHAEEVVSWCRENGPDPAVRTMMGSGWGHD